MQGRRVAAIDEGNDVELPRGKRQIKVQPTRKFCLVAIFPLDCVRPSDQLFCVAFCSVERYSIGGYGVITTSKSSRKLSNWSGHFKSTMDACVAICRRGWCYCCFFCCQDDDADGQQTKEQTCAPFRSKENIYYSRQKVEEAKKNDSAQDGQCDAR